VDKPVDNSGCTCGKPVDNSRVVDNLWITYAQLMHNLCTTCGKPVDNLTGGGLMLAIIFTVATQAQNR
jgi:hypothetical protein